MPLEKTTTFLIHQVLLQTMMDMEMEAIERLVLDMEVMGNTKGQK